MKWEEIKRAGFIEIDGHRYDLGHLADHPYTFNIEASPNHDAVSFEVMVQYSSHCVSWGVEHGEFIDFDDHGHQRRIVDHRGNDRCFCETRFSLSAHLPDIFATIIERKVFFAGRENYLIVEVTDHDGAQVHYEIYFNVRHESARFLRLVVESAYVRDDPATRPSARDKIRMKVLFGKKLRREPIRRPPP